ncbi:MAG: DUF3667 domain-containing protein [Bacteroidales bacterium]|nr:DUF3667 domain-containing protein [Bacteroidales bacterium]
MEYIVFCQNCGEELAIATKYCPFCGQKKILKEDYTFKRLLKESIFDFLHIDAKLFNSIFPLLFRPGYLTKQWLAGKHVRYFKPFKMFLVISILYFLLASINEHYIIKWATTEQERAGSIGFTFSNFPDSVNRPSNEIIAPDETMDYMDRQAEKFDKMGNGKITEYLTKNISKLIALLVPLVALLLKLIYIRKKKLYYEHLIFTLHIHAFIFLFAVIIELISMTTGYFMNYWIVMPLILIYIFVALKRIYKQKFFMTLLSNILLWAGYILIIFPIFIMITVIVSIAMA